MKLENVMTQWVHLAKPQDGYYKVEMICLPDQAAQIDAEIDTAWEKWQKKEKSTKSPAWIGGRKVFEKDLPILDIDKCLELVFRDNPDLDMTVAEWLEKTMVSTLKKYQTAHKQKKLVSFVAKQSAEKTNTDGTVNQVKPCVYKLLGTERFASDEIPFLSNGSICIIGFEPFVSQFKRDAGITLGLRSVQPLLYSSFSGDGSGGTDIAKLVAAQNAE